MSSYKPSYRPGDWKATCDVCGFTFKASELKDRWDGLKVCDKDWESRHPADFIKAPRGDRPLPWARPEPADVVLAVPYVSSSVGNQDLDIPESTFGPFFMLLEDGVSLVLLEDNSSKIIL